MTKVDPYRRYQAGLNIADVYPPQKPGVCRCGCGRPLLARRRAWATDACQKRAVTEFLILKGDGGVIRAALLERDGGVCRACGLVCAPAEWEADHIIPVHRGGGACDLDGFQTLCVPCHAAKSAREQLARAA